MEALAVAPVPGLGETMTSGLLGLASLVDPVVTDLPTTSNRSRMRPRP